MCGHERIRYVHILIHPEVEDTFHVGCDCALKMLNDYVTPTKNERDFRNKLKRRENFLDKDWVYKAEKETYSLRYKGEYITIIKSKFGMGFGIIFCNNSYWKFRGEKIMDLDTAKQVAFELFNEMFQ